MKGLLQHILSQPRSVRDTYAFWGALLCTGVLVLVWMGTSTAQIRSVAIYTPESSEVPAVQAEEVRGENSWPLSGFWQRLRANVSTAWSDVSD